MRERNVEELLKLIVQLEATEFVGVCKILGVQLVEKVEEEDKARERSFEAIWNDVCEKVDGLNRRQRRNLRRIVRTAVKGKDEGDR